MDGWMVGWLDGWLVGWLAGLSGLDGWMHGQDTGEGMFDQRREGEMVGWLLAGWADG